MNIDLPERAPDVDGATPSSAGVTSWAADSGGGSAARCPGQGATCDLDRANSDLFIRTIATTS